ncbi:hypothetical protein [Nocardia sp. NPDC019395]|uniref:DUF7373 family lipoprotein n=1 Tax=Nocardia sp. NPDC019395 TaxID=3154686 RepID=UPI003401023F
MVLDRRDMSGLVVNDTFDEVASDLVTGWVHTWATEGAYPDTRELSIAVLMFPDAEAAGSAATRLEHDDFTYNAENRPVEIPEYSHSKAHWRPGVSSLGSWTSHDRYVVFAKYTDFSDKRDLPSMVRTTQALLDAQIPLLDEFEPTPADQLENIQLDPDGLLALAYPKSEELTALTGPSGFFRGRGALHALSGFEDLRFLDTGRVTGIALAETVVMESESAVGAEALWEIIRPPADNPAEGRVIESPEGIGGKVICFARAMPPGASQSNFCALQTGRYVAQVEGSQIQDLHQKTSAQYVLLASR